MADLRKLSLFVALILLLASAPAMAASVEKATPPAAGEMPTVTPPGESGGLPEDEDTIPDSYTLQGTPCALMPSMEVESGEELNEEGVCGITVLKGGIGYGYLEDTHGVINFVGIEEVYRNNRNPYELPLMVLPNGTDLSPVRDALGQDLLQMLERDALIKDGHLTEAVNFFSVKFKKEGENYVVTNWMPEIILHELSQKDGP